MNSILITGGAGFIGSNLCKELIAQGHRVHAVDNLVTGFKNNIVPLLDNPRFSFYELDITDNAFVETFKDVRLDRIYHLACPTGVPNLTTLAEEMLRTCSIGTFNVLEIARKQPHGARVLLTSTAEMYGDPLVSPQHEGYTGNVDPIGPRSAYEEGKRFAEAAVAMYARKYGVDGVIVRIFNTYGPGMSLEDTRVIPQFIRSVRDNKPFTIYGDGTQTRSHLYIDDQLRGLQTVMEKGKTGEAYNVGSDTPMTIRDLAELVISLTNHAPGVTYVPHFTSDHASRHPSVERARVLGWSQQVSIEDGLRKMVQMYLTPSSVLPNGPVAPL